MGFKSGGMPYYNLTSPLFRSHGKIPCADKLVQYTKAPAVSTESYNYLKDRFKGTTTGIADGRDEVGGAYFDGDGIRRIDLGIALLPKLDDFVVEFKDIEFSQLVERNGIINQYTAAQEGRLFFASEVGENLRLFFNGVGAEDVQLLAVNTKYNIILKRVNGVFEVYVNGDLRITLTGEEGTNIYQGANTTLSVDSGTNYLQGKMPTAIINNYEADFETGNQDTKVEFANKATGDRFQGTIQGADGSDRVKTTAVKSAMDYEGYTTADGVNHFYDQALTQLVPSGKRSLNVNGLSGFYTADSVPNYAPSDWVGELRGDVGFCDAAGTLGADTAHIIELTTKKTITDADNLTTVKHFNRDDADNIYPIPVAVADQVNVDNPRFTQTKDGAITKQLLYSEELDAECIEKVDKFMGFKSPLSTAEGSLTTLDGTITTMKEGLSYE